MLRQALLGVAVLLAGVAAPAYGQDVKLQLKFKEGDKFYVEDVNKSKETVGLPAAGVTQTTENKVTSVTSFTIKKVTTESTEVEMKIESVEVQSNGTDGLLGKIMGKMKGATFTFTLTPDGKIKKFEGYKQWVKSVAGDDDDNSKFLKLFLSEDLFFNMVEKGFTFLPDKSVKKGETWTNESRIPFSSMGELKSKNTYTYDGRENNLDIIAVKQAMKYTPAKAGTEILDGVKITRADLKVENSRGKYFFDAAKGRPEKVEMAMTITGSLTVDVVGQQQQLDLTVVSTGTSRVLDKSPAKN
jgi:hypothetical protein